MATAVSTNDERHVSSLIVALEFYPQMAIKMIHKWPLNIVLMMIQNDPNNKFMKSLNDSETKLISTLSTDGFNKLDMSLLYKLIRYFNLVLEPSEKWGNRPLATNINHGDDMERMRLNRNDLVHRPRGGLSEEERDKFFKESIEIARRVDNFIGDSTSSFETGIRNVKIHHITQEKYRQVLEKCVELQQQLKDISRINRVDLYYGDDIAVKLGHQDLPATDSTRCTIYVRDPNMNVPTVIEQLEQAKKRLNEGDYNIILLAATSGSLVLHVEIHNLCFITKDSLHNSIAEFLRRVFTSISGSLDQHIMEVVLAECDSYIISDNEEKNDEYLNDQESSVLKLDVMVRNTSLQSETDLYRDVHGFISKVLDVTDKDVESTNGSPLAVTMTSQHVDERAASTALLDDNASPFKQPRVPKEDHIMAEATISRHESNYIKITVVVLQISPRAVRVQFDKEFHPVHLQRTLNRNISLLTDLKMKKHITQPQWNLLFPRTGEPSSKDFDITLMICLLRNLIPIDIMDRLPSATDTSLRADLSRIKYYRNIIVNFGILMLDDTVFESYWNDVTPAILRLGGNYLKAECDYWYGRNLDAGQKELVETNKKLIELEQEQEQSTDLELAEIKKKLIELEQEQSTKLVETNKKLIELEQEQEQSTKLAEIKKKLIELEQEQSNPVHKNSREPVMPVTESICSFKGFSDVYPSCKKLTHELARLFDKCEFEKEGIHRHTISFREATARLRTAVENSLSDVEIITGKKVSEFRIGKTSVTSQENLTFDPMKPMTWGEVGGTNGKWREHKKEDYDGLFEVGCVTNELIPKVIKEANTAIRMGHQMYALGMAQDLVHHYMIHELDGRLRNKSIDIRNCSEGKIGDKGGIIYVAYKLESGNIFEVDSLFIKEEEQEVLRTAIIGFLKMELEEEGLHFRGSIPDDGNSFFKACSDQLQRLEIPGHTHTELRQMVIPTLKFCSEDEIKSANFTSDTWKIYINKVAKDKENVEDIVVETMAKLLRRQIIVCSRSYTNEISRKKFNEEANGTPLLLAKDKLCYQSLERRHGTPSRLQESNTSKRAAGTAFLDDYTSPFKQPRATQEDHIFGISSVLQGTSHEKSPEKAYVSEVESEKGPNEKKTRNVMKKMTKDEKMLILRSYIILPVKSDWDQLADNVYKSRYQALSRETIKHYEDNLNISTTLKSRIKGYIHNVQRGNRDKETDPEITALMNIVQPNEQAASQRGLQNVHVNVVQR